MSNGQKENITKKTAKPIEKDNGNDKFDSFHNAFVENIVSNKVIDQKDNRTDAVVDQIKDFADKTKEEKIKKEAFQSYFTRFINKTTDKEMYAKFEDRKIFCRINDVIKVNDIILNTDNNKTYKIKSIGIDRANLEISYAGIKLSYWCNEAEVSFVSEEANNSELPALFSQLEEGIKAAKDGFLIKKKPEALKLLKFFKNVIKNKENEEILFNRFDAVLNSLDPNLSQIAKKIISLM